MIYLWEPRDREGAIGVVREVFDEYGFEWDEGGYHADLYDVPKLYFEAGDLFFVAKVDGHVVGTVAVEFFPVIAGDEPTAVDSSGKIRVTGADCSLERLYVRPSARGNGIGRLLFETVICEARNRGCRAMEIWSDKRFQTAHRLYERFGAQTVGQRICDDPDESPEFGLKLCLAD